MTASSTASRCGGCAGERGVSAFLPLLQDTHGSSQGNARGSHPRVKEVFAKLHGTDQLLASFDGMSLFRPAGLNAGWQQTTMDFHTDRRPHFNPEQPWQPSGVDHR